MILSQFVEHQNIWLPKSLKRKATEKQLIGGVLALLYTNLFMAYLHSILKTEMSFLIK
jgi:hypothetical protein